MKVSSITKNMLQGSLQQTAIPSDIAIDGDGFFVVQIGKKVMVHHQKDLQEMEPLQ